MSATNTVLSFFPQCDTEMLSNDMASSSRNAYFLPNELWEKIFGCMQEDVSCLRHGYYRRDPYTFTGLLAVNLVCRKFRQLATRSLYERIVLGGRSINFVQLTVKQNMLAEVLSNNLQYCSRVRFLHLLVAREETDHSFEPLLKLIQLTSPYLRELQLWKPTTALSTLGPVSDIEAAFTSKLIKCTIQGMPLRIRAAIIDEGGSRLRFVQSNDGSALHKLRFRGRLSAYFRVLNLLLQDGADSYVAHLEHLEYEDHSDDLADLRQLIALPTSLKTVRLVFHDQAFLRRSQRVRKLIDIQRVIELQQDSLEVIRLDNLPDFRLFDSPMINIQALTRLKSLGLSMGHFFAGEPDEVWPQWLVPSLEALELYAWVRQDSPRTFMDDDEMPRYNVVFDAIHGAWLVECIESRNAYIKYGGLSLKTITYRCEHFHFSADRRITRRDNQPIKNTGPDPGFLTVALEATALQLEPLGVKLYWDLPRGVEYSLAIPARSPS